MKIFMTLLVRDEEDILEDNLRFHHEQGVDGFIITDNLSTDRTAEIVRSLSSEMDIEYIYQPEDTYDQSQWVTSMARRAAREHNADWVINNDADEFWVASCGTLRSFLETVPDDVGILQIERHNAVLSADGPDFLQARSHPRTSTAFECESRNIFGTALPGKCLHRGENGVVVPQGNHNAHGIAGRKVIVKDDLKILHFPYRTLGQYRRKIRAGGKAYSQNASLPESIGSTWREHYRLIDTGAIEDFWRDLAKPRQSVAIGLASGSFFQNDQVRDTLEGEAERRREARMLDGLQTLADKTQEQISELGKELTKNIKRIESKRWPTRPLYYSFEFSLRGPGRQLAILEELSRGASVASLCKDFARLRDAFSLFPRNEDFREFLKELLFLGFPEDVARLRADCNGKRVVLHISCLPKLQKAEASAATFSQLGEGYHDIIISGSRDDRSEDDTPLWLDYDGRHLRIPVSDNYESLHKKVFYALCLLDLATDVDLVIKVDDDLHLDSAQSFSDLVETLSSDDTTCAGRVVGSPRHQDQWHGWHVGKCSDPIVEGRGYQFPLPRRYPAGGYGYCLNRRGVAACAYMYLAMRGFFAMPLVGLEDVYVGHALFSEGLDVKNVSSVDHELAFPGLRSLEHYRCLGE